MLQFIVLGIVPGTSIQLNFSDIILSGGALFVILAALQKLHSRGQRRKLDQLVIGSTAL